MVQKFEPLIIADDPKDFTHVEVDPKDRDAIRKFLAEYEGLSTGELGVLCNRSNQTVRHWKRLIKAEMRSNPFKRNYAKGKKVEVEIVTDPKIWDNRDWFYSQYSLQGRGKALIARIIQRSPILVYMRLKEYKIERRKFIDVVRSTNACCCEAWLYFNYATHDEYVEWCVENKVEIKELGGRGLGLVECSKIAGVVPYTIFNWLTKFKMHIRDLGAAAINGHRKLNKALQWKNDGQATTNSKTA